MLNADGYHANANLHYSALWAPHSLLVTFILSLSIIPARDKPNIMGARLRSAEAAF